MLAYIGYMATSHYDNMTLYWKIRSITKKNSLQNFFFSDKKETIFLHFIVLCINSKMLS